jgi:hypothetical protein
MSKQLATYRVESALLAAVRTKADQSDDTVTAVIIRAFEAYVGKATAAAIRARSAPDVPQDDCEHPRQRRSKGGLCMACGHNVPAK